MGPAIKQPKSSSLEVIVAMSNFHTVIKKYLLIDHKPPEINTCLLNINYEDGEDLNKQDFTAIL